MAASPKSPSSAMYSFSPDAHRGALPLSTALLAETPSLSLALARGLGNQGDHRLRLAKAYIVPHLGPSSPPTHRRPSSSTSSSSAPTSSMSSPPLTWTESEDSSSSEDGNEWDNLDDDEIDDDIDDDDIDDDEDDDSESDAGDEWEVRNGQIVLSPRAVPPEREEGELPQAPPSTPRASASSAHHLLIPGLAMLSRSSSGQWDDDRGGAVGTPKAAGGPFRWEEDAEAMMD